MKLNRRSLFIGAVTLTAQMLLAGTVLAHSDPETREYSAENGYKITITSRGNVIGLETPGGAGVPEGAEPREGYVISYVDSAGIVRVVHDVYDIYSSVITPGERDFVQASFTAPPSQSNIPLNTMISATAIVDTRDGLLRLSNEITWRAGTGVVKVKMTVTNRSDRQSVRVINVKRVLAPLGLGMDLTSSITRGIGCEKDSGRSLGLRIDPECSDCFLFSQTQRTPDPPPIPWLFMCSPRPLQSPQPPHMLLARVDDLYDLQNVGPGESLGDYVTGIQTQGIFVFQINSIMAPLGSAGGKNVNYGMQ